MTHIELSHRKSCDRSIRLGDIGRLFDIARQRRALTQLDDHILEDIGVSRKQAQAEATRPLWDAPANWFKQNH